MQPRRQPDRTCSACGSVYEVHSIKWPEREKGEALCRCGEILLKWRSSTEYIFRLKKEE